MSGLVGLYNPRPVDDVPVNGQLQHGVTSNRMFDHEADPDAHHPEETPEGRGEFGGTILLSTPGFYGTNVATLNHIANRIQYSPILVRTPITVNQVTIEVTGAAGAGNKCRIGIYEADTSWQPGDLVVASAEIAIDAVAVLNAAIAATVLTQGRYLIAIHTQANATLRVLSQVGNATGYNPVFGSSPTARTLYKNTAYVALPTPGVDWDAVAYIATGGYFPVLLRISVP